MKLAAAAGSAASPAVAGTIKRSLCAGRSQLTTHNSQQTNNKIMQYTGLLAWGMGPQQQRGSHNYDAALAVAGAGAERG